MSDCSRALQWLIWGLLTMAILGISAAFIDSRLRERGRPLPVISQVEDFTLTNQFGERVTLADLRGKVWVADIIFTRCAGPCPRMTQQLGELQRALPPDPRLKFVTLTTDPEFDTPAMLHRYGQQYGADTNRWLFLTGTKAEIAKLAVGGLKLAALEKDPKERESEVDLFIHSTTFVVVDKRGRMRGGFQTTEPDYQQPIIKAVQRLLRER
jgi:cytochrome oxidase Cu insertion factor (SCO1/SenC/PrrC family)